VASHFFNSKPAKDAGITQESFNMLNNSTKEFEDILEDQFEIEDDTYVDKVKRKAQRKMFLNTPLGFHNWIGLLLNISIILTSIKLIEFF
jgi:hypothetical protein